MKMPLLREFDGRLNVLQHNSAKEAKEACARFKSKGHKASPDMILQLTNAVEVAWTPQEPLSWGNAVIGSDVAQIALVQQYGSESALP